MARTDYGAILSTVIQGTSNAIRHSEGTSSLIAPKDWAREINKLKVMPTKKIKGSICSFSDGADNSPIISLSASVSGSGCNVVKTGKNLIEITASFPQSPNGVTFTLNEDKSISTSGTATADITLQFATLPLGVGTYTLSGCPSGGSSTKYELNIGGGIGGHDYGEGLVINITQAISLTGVRLVIKSGTNVTGLTFKPMLEKNSVVTEFEGYKKTTYPITFPSSVTSGSITINADGTIDLTSGGTTTRLTDTVDIRTYYGANNIWVDTGDISNLEYYADSELLYIGQMIEETATGDIASFSDGANDIPLKNLTCTINPVQDLHGQDYPYPNGGSKNELPMSISDMKSFNTTGTWNGNAYTLNGVTFSVLTDTANNITGIEVNGTATAAATFCIAMYVLKEGTSKKINGTSIAPSDTTISYGFRGYGTVSANADRTMTRDASAGDWDNDVYINVATGYTANGIMYYPMIRDASISDGTFAPYSNICPITGHTACTVTNDKYYGGEIDFNQLVPNANRDFVNTRTETNQTINFLFRLNSSPYTAFYNKQTFPITGDFGFIAKATATGKAQMLHNGQRTQALFVNNIDVTNNHIYIGLLYFTSCDITTVGGLVVNNIMLIDLTQMFGETKANEIYAMEQATTGDGVAYVRSILPHDYYDYTVSTVETAMEANGEVNPEVTTDLGTTVYGGTLDVVSGVLTVTYGMIKLSDIPKTKYGTYEAGARFITTFFDTISNTKLMGNSLLLNAIGKTLQTPYPTSGSWLHFSAGSSKTSFLIDQADVGEGVQLNVSNVNSWLDSINAYAVYELATPTTIQLTPQEVKSLLGGNNIYHDCNGQVAVTYRANGQLYVEQHT